MYYDRVNNVLHKSLAEVVPQGAGYERDWNESSITSRVMKHMTKAANDQEVLSASGDEALTNFVQRAMQGLTNACGESEWLFRIDLFRPFLAVAQVIAQQNRSMEGYSYEKLERRVRMEVEDCLERAFLDKAMWKICEARVHDPKAKSKVFKAISNSYWVALEVALDDGNLERDLRSGLDEMAELRRLELFMDTWITETTNRGWAIMEQENLLNEGELVSLFKAMIKPFHNWEFSCIPYGLVETVGTPPVEWAYTRKCVRKLVRQWDTNNGTTMPPKKKQRTQKQWDNQTYEQKNTKQEQGEADYVEQATGHPLCTSGDACVGNPDSKLVRHMTADGQPGDLYCEDCWNNFVEENPSLEGVFEDA